MNWREPPNTDKTTANFPGALRFKSILIALDILLYLFILVPEAGVQRSMVEALEVQTRRKATATKGVCFGLTPFACALFLVVVFAGSSVGLFFFATSTAAGGIVPKANHGEDGAGSAAPAPSPGSGGGIPAPSPSSQPPSPGRNLEPFVVDSFSVAMPKVNFSVNASTVHLHVQVSTGICSTTSGQQYSFTIDGNEIIFENANELYSHDTSILYISLPSTSLTANSTVTSSKMRLTANPSTVESCEISELSASIPGGHEYSTWTSIRPEPSDNSNATAGDPAFVPMKDEDCVWEYGMSRCKFPLHCSRQRRVGDETLSDECRLTSTRRRAWSWPDWLNPWASDDDAKKEEMASFNTSNLSSFNTTAVDILAGTLNTTVVEPEDGCFFFCSFFKTLVNTEIDATKIPYGVVYEIISNQEPPFTARRQLRQTRVLGSKNMKERATCVMASAFNGVRFSVSTIGDLLQGRQTSFSVDPQCVFVDLPTLLGLKSKWLNPVPRISAYKIDINGLAFDYFTFKYSPRTVDANGEHTGTNVFIRIGGLRTMSSGKVALEAVNPIRTQSCKKIGCGKGRQGWWSWLNAPQNA